MEEDAKWDIHGGSGSAARADCGKMFTASASQRCPFFPSIEVTREQKRSSAVTNARGGVRSVATATVELRWHMATVERGKEGPFHSIS